MSGSLIIRPIEPGDNSALATIIRTTLEEFGANHPGTVYFDASTDHLFELFRETNNAAYFVAVENEQLLGGAGIFPTEGLPADTCELVKMYLATAARGKGLGGRLITTCLEYASSQGFSQVYLESMPELQKALTVYERFGFEYLQAPLGNTGHFGCERWMLKKIG